MNSLLEGTKRIIEAIGRKKGRFAFGPIAPDMQAQFRTTSPFMLSVGAWSFVAVKGGGAICSVGMTREHVGELRDLCNEALGESETKS